MTEEFEQLLESMWMDIATETSVREEMVYNGHVIVCEEIPATTTVGRHAIWFVDGKLVDYQDIEALVIK